MIEIDWTLSDRQTEIDSQKQTHRKRVKRER